jgi:hypothetical protein
METARTILQQWAAAVLEKLPPSVHTTINTPIVRKLLTFVVAWNVVKLFNRILSGFVLNNWQSDRYDWPRELVLVTGGSDGIGKAVAEDLAGRGIKVVILDIQEPKSPLREFPYRLYFLSLSVLILT